MARQKYYFCIIMPKKFSVCVRGLLELDRLPRSSNDLPPAKKFFYVNEF